MNYTKIIGRAVEITGRHRALWVYGFLLALFGGGAGNMGQSFRWVGHTGSQNGMPPSFHTGWGSAAWLILLATAVLVVLVIAIVGVIARYVSLVALIGMVRDVEDTGRTDVRGGLRWGWSARAWRVFLIGLLVGLPLFIVAISLIGFSLSPLILLATGQKVLQVGGVLVTIVLVLFVVLLLIVVSFFVNLLLEMVYRECVLLDRGVLDSLRVGIERVRQRPGPIVIMGLLLVGLGWLWGIVMIPVALFMIGAVAIPALVAYTTVGVVAALIVGAPLAVVAVVILSAVSGLFAAFRSTAWTLTYLELTLPAQTLAENALL
jgi:hypothetical protein